MPEVNPPVVTMKVNSNGWPPTLEVMQTTPRPQHRIHDLSSALDGGRGPCEILGSEEPGNLFGDLKSLQQECLLKGGKGILGANKRAGNKYNRACCLDGPCLAGAETSVLIETVHTEVRNRSELMVGQLREL